MSTAVNVKLQLMRESERLNMREMADLAGISYTTYVGYEWGKAKLSYEASVKIFRLERFRKYQDWFMFDETNPDRGQVAPALAHCGQEETTSRR
ncbi:helix-turn-helix transcriptional regulator [Salmonella enterica]|nr:XRE family transcriptional regulator [Salmonella enterica]ECD6161684.1 XRE family transcriptional regulator [Salmonella enterica subsp. enterica]EAW3042993.1 helix-turn-helix transcriptional regulator [Salmonella enterica]EAW3064146.1 helix-turn-helix transcriptional regulator [Salmonella enterica]EBN6858313.1 XRE family transcriptional regulator [Salmonella enterica]